MAAQPPSKQYPWSFRILEWILVALAKRTVLVYMAVIGSYVLGYAIALPSKEWPAISTWIIVAGNAPFVLGAFLVLTCPIWGRKGRAKDRPWAECGRCGSKEAFIDEGRIVCIWCDDYEFHQGVEEEGNPLGDSQRVDAYSNMAEQDADEAGEARRAADLVQPPPIVSWALRRNRDTETRDE